MPDGGSTVVILSILAVIVGFLPSIAALIRRHIDTRWIFAVNALGVATVWMYGLGMIFWVWAIIWAFNSNWKAIRE